jgi:hypothetical protein
MKLSTEILMRLGKACTCGNRSVDPAAHGQACPWLADAVRELAEKHEAERAQMEGI